MGTIRKVRPNIAINPEGAVVTIMADSTHFPQLKKACQRLQKQLPKKIVRIGEFASKSYILITFERSVTQDEAAQIIREFSYEVD